MRDAMGRAWRRWLPILLCAGAALACGSGSDGSGGKTGTRVPDPDANFPRAPAEFFGALVYVDPDGPACGGELPEPDGSPARPFCRVTDALDSLEPDRTPVALLLAGATYPERVLIDREATWIVGASEGRGPRLEPQQDGAALLFDRATDVHVLHVDIGATRGEAVHIRGGSVRLVGVEIDGVSAVDAERPGHGIQVQDGARLQATDVAVANASGVGVLVDGSTLDATDLVVTGAEAGGVRLQRAADADLTRPVLSDCRVFGLGVYGSQVEVSDGAIRGTRRSGIEGGDGVVVAPRAGESGRGEARLKGTRVEDNARLGVLVDDVAEARFEAVVVANNTRGGLWAQHLERPVMLIDSEILGNHVAGVAAVEGAAVEIEGGRVADTLAGLAASDGAVAEEVGDGLLALAGGRISANGTDVLRTFRAALFVDAAAGRIDGGNVAAARYGVVVQNDGDGVLDPATVDVDELRIEPPEPLAVLGAVEAFGN